MGRSMLAVGPNPSSTEERTNGDAYRNSLQQDILTPPNVRFKTANPASAKPPRMAETEVRRLELCAFENVRGAGTRPASGRARVGP
jgi:hypothetical protein